MRALYSCIFYLLTPFLLFKLWRRGKTAPAYRQRIGERFGLPSKISPVPPLWVHAVSVGETVAIAAVIKQLLSTNPLLSVLVTTSTPTGAERVTKLFAEYPQVWHQYCPYDQPMAIGRFIKKHRPTGLLIVETELWPNMLAKCQHYQVPVILANARMSEKSARGYAKFSTLSKGMLNRLDLLVAQYDSDAERFVRLGVAREKLVIGGSIKFDLEHPGNNLEQARLFREAIGARPVVVLASSHAGEELGVLECATALRKHFPKLLLIIAPRHPERFDAVYQLAKEHADVVFKRSTSAVDDQCQVYVADTMGEMSMLYASADLAIVGGSFVPVGGQNPIEPASLAKGVLMGPQQYNFSVICPQLEAAGGMYSCADFTALAGKLEKLLANPEQMVVMGECAKAYYLSQRGATKLLVEQVQQRLLG